MKDHNYLCKVRIIEGWQKDCTCSYKLIEPLLDRINRLEWALSQFARGHYTCDDSYYSCPQSADEIEYRKKFPDSYDEDDNKCNCGSDSDNKFIADTLKEGESIREQYFNESTVH